MDLNPAQMVGGVIMVSMLVVLLVIVIYMDTARIRDRPKEVPRKKAPSWHKAFRK